MSPRTTPDDDTPWVDILGVRVHAVTWDEALARMQGFVREGTPHHIVTVNPEFVMMAQDDEPFREVINQAHLSVADGTGLLLAARLQGHCLPERVTGTDAVDRLARLGHRLYFLGAAPGVAEQAAEKLQRRYPEMTVAGTWPGSPAPEEEEDIVARVRAAAPEILFVAWGAPAQDLWIRRNLDRLGVPVCMGVGGAFDFHAGLVPRAPVIMQRSGTEWLFRLAIQRWRIKRMKVLPRFVAMAARQGLAVRAGRAS